MDKPIDDHTELSKQTEKDKYHDITYIWNLKKVQMNLPTKHK